MIKGVGQLDFIKIANETKNILSISQSENGATTLNLRPDVSIMHNYTGANKMVIIFKENQDRYLIPDRRTLLYLTGMHQTHDNFVQWAHIWCHENLKSV